MNLELINTEDAIFRINKTMNWEHDNSRCLGMFLDVRKAFDTVNHSKLLENLFMIEIRGIELKLF